jgi:hypothetical protein
MSFRYISRRSDWLEFHVTPDDGIVCRSILCFIFNFFFGFSLWNHPVIFSFVIQHVSPSAITIISTLIMLSLFPFCFLWSILFLFFYKYFDNCITNRELFNLYPQYAFDHLESNSLEESPSSYTGYQMKRFLKTKLWSSGYIKGVGDFEFRFYFSFSLSFCWKILESVKKNYLSSPRFDLKWRHHLQFSFT